MFGFIKRKVNSGDIKEQINCQNTSIENNEKLSIKSDVIIADDGLVKTQNHNNTQQINRTNKFRQHLEDYHLSKNGLYPDEILMLSIASDYYATGYNEFSQSFKMSNNIQNPQKILKILEYKGFIQQGGLKECLMKQKVKTLKDELSANGLKTSGKKDELISRLIEGVDNAVLESKYPERPYVLTDLGDDELKENEYVSYISTHPPYSKIGIWEMNHLLYFENPKNLGYRDILWQELVKQSLESYGEDDFGFYRYCYYHLYNIAVYEEKYETAFHMMAEVLYFNLSGLCGGDGYKRNKKLFLQLLLEYNLPKISKLDSDARLYGCTVSLEGYYVRDLLPEMKIKLNISSDEEYYEALLTKFKDVDKRCPFHVFTPEESANICIWELNKDVEKLADVYRQAVLRIQKMYDEL